MRWQVFLTYLCLAGAGVAAALTGADPPARATAVEASGSLSIANSRDATPVFTAAGIGPGESTVGRVEIADNGAVPVALVLSQHDLLDTPGAGGGLLSAALALRIDDVTAPAPVTVYAGPLAPMPPQRLGRLGVGESRTYEFVATLPDSGLGDQNDLQAAAASVAYAWTAEEADEEGPAPAPPPPATGAAGGLAANPPPALRLAVTRIRRAIRHGRLLVRAGCDSRCRIVVRGRLRAGSEAGRRSAELHLSRRPRLASGPQRLAIRIPAGLRRWLREVPGRVWLVARISFLARDQAGRVAVVRRTVRPHGS